MIKSSQLVLDQLQERLEMPVKAFVATDYNGVIEALRAGKLDVAYLGPFSYVLANKIAGAEAFAVALTKKTSRCSSNVNRAGRSCSAKTLAKRRMTVTPCDRLVPNSSRNPCF